MNQPGTSPRRLHPLIATAAATLIIASLAATAAITGLFPKASSTASQTDQTQSSQVANQPVVDSAAPAAGNQQAPSQPQQGAYAAPSQAQAEVQPQPQQLQQQQQYAQQQPANAQQPQPSYAQTQPYGTPPPQQQATPCATCGTVESIATVRREGHGTGIGAVGGAVAGGLVGNQFGAGTGRTAMTVLGAVGGGFAGNAVEKHLRSETNYQVRVRMENGRTRYFTYRQAPPFQQGQPVRVERGTLVAR
ncbi:glycine zipper 2TM domain-containing protein [Trinickia sp. LjRoot230]|uniref:glycine zipper 2TM domain-containing protein n=1 Tax=Trinickia sp. LjRoot230 TaxID=3342288 RepID=UPI003ECE0DA1